MTCGHYSEVISLDGLQKFYWQKLYFWINYSLYLQPFGIKTLGKPFYLPLISLHPYLLCCSVTPYYFSHMISSYLSSPNFSLILFLSVGIFLCPSSPALESESSPLPSAHLPRHLRSGMASRSTTPPPLHVSQSDSAMLRKSVSFSEELLLAVSGRTHPLLPPWHLTLGAVTASSVTTPTPMLPPGRISCPSLHKSY